MMGCARLQCVTWNYAKRKRLTRVSGGFIFLSLAILFWVGKVFCMERFLSISCSQEVNLLEESATWLWLQGLYQRAVTYASR